MKRTKIITRRSQYQRVSLALTTGNTTWPCKRYFCAVLKLRSPWVVSPESVVWRTEVDFQHEGIHEHFIEGCYRRPESCCRVLDSEDHLMDRRAIIDPRTAFEGELVASNYAIPVAEPDHDIPFNTVPTCITSRTIERDVMILVLQRDT